MCVLFVGVTAFTNEQFKFRDTFFNKYIHRSLELFFWCGWRVGIARVGVVVGVGVGVDVCGFVGVLV